MFGLENLPVGGSGREPFRDHLLKSRLFTGKMAIAEARRKRLLT
jgi:hypothetical protein